MPSNKQAIKDIIIAIISEQKMRPASAAGDGGAAAAVGRRRTDMKIPTSGGRATANPEPTRPVRGAQTPSNRDNYQLALLSSAPT